MRSRFNTLLALAFLVSAWCAPVALGQNSVRGPLQTPVPMQMREEPKAPPAQRAEEAPAGETATGAGKFPNRDTAKNRRDYTMSTDGGEENVSIGRDEATGDDVLRAKPKKREQQRQNPFEGQPIQVKPVIPVVGGGR